MGNGSCKDTHLSIYLCLQGEDSGNKYIFNYKIELVNFEGKENYDKGWTHDDFEPNQGWGRDQYYKLKDIEKDGFIDDEGNLTINCYLKPRSINEIIKAIKNRE